MSDGIAIVQRVAAKALLVNDEGKVLILREAPTYKDGTNIGRYHLPGGRIEPGEKYLDGLRREVREETGLEIEAGKPMYVGEWFPNIRGVQHHIVCIFFVCKALGSDVVLSDEHDDFIWINPAEYEQYDLMDTEPAVIKAWLDQ